MLRFYEGSLSYSDIKSFGYKDACKFFEYAIKTTNSIQDSIKNQKQKS